MAYSHTHKHIYMHACTYEANKAPMADNTNRTNDTMQHREPHTHTYIHTYIHTHTYKHTQPNIQTYITSGIDPSIHTYINHTQSDRQRDRQTVNTYIQRCKHAYAQKHLYT